jgi:hypothetical protein
MWQAGPGSFETKVVKKIMSKMSLAQSQCGSRTRTHTPKRATTKTELGPKWLRNRSAIAAHILPHRALTEPTTESIIHQTPDALNGNIADDSSTRPCYNHTVPFVFLRTALRDSSKLEAVCQCSKRCHELLLTTGTCNAQHPENSGLLGEGRDRDIHQVSIGRCNAQLTGVRAAGQTNLIDICLR